MNLGPTVELEIAALGARGDGIGARDGQTFYVPYVLPGERAIVRPGQRRGDGIAAEPVEVTRPSPHRVAPACGHFGVCGGCAVQHLDDEAYATWKRGLLVEALTRASVAASKVAPLIRIAPGTRRRASLGFVRAARGLVLGFARRASHDLVDVAACPVLAPTLVALLAPLREALTRALPVGAKGEAVATATETGIDLVIGTEAKLGLPAREALAAFADRHDIARISWRRPGAEAEPVAARRAPLVRPGGVAVELPPGGFLQPSAEGEATLAKLATDAVDELAPASARVADLYAGCGSFALPLGRTRPVHAVEGDAQSLAALARAAGQARLRITTEVRDLARKPLRGKELAGFAAVCFDPPRIGAASQAKALAEAGPALVVAVSCNPATLGRDVRTLLDGGYQLVRATPVDQFLWSARLEAVAVLTR